MTRFNAGMLTIRMLLATMLGMGAATSLSAQDAGESQDGADRDMDAKHCVRIDNIETIDVINDRTLRFRMRVGPSYRNDLPRRCPGLDGNDTLMYRSSVGQLCNIDIVTVLDDWGFGFSPGVSCSLGMFHPITEPPVTEPMAEEAAAGEQPDE